MPRDLLTSGRPGAASRATPAAAVAVALLIAAVAGASVAGRFDSAGPPVEFFRIAIGSEADAAKNVHRYAYVVTNAWRLDARRAIRGAPPRALVYKNLSFVDCGDHADDPKLPAGVRCGEARDRGWIVRDAAGQEVRSQTYPWLYLADVADSGYQRRWADNVADEARADGWDGVSIDDANSTLRYHLPGELLTGDLADDRWREATGRALDAVGRRLRREGLTVVANICCQQHHRGVWKDWIGDLSGWSLEHFVKSTPTPSAGLVPPEEWLRHLEAAAETQARGKLFVGVTTSSSEDEAAATYGLSTLLLATRGSALFALQDGVNSEEIWFPVYDRARRLGAPRGDYERIGSAYRRLFENGVVYVNPQPEPAAAGGVDLGPHTGLIDLDSEAGEG